MKNQLKTNFTINEFNSIFIKISFFMKYTQEEIIKIFKSVHNEKYDYTKVIYDGKFKKVCIVCKKHGEFHQTPHNHTNGKGCPKCAKKFMDTEYFIELAIEKHNNKYNYSEVVYKTAKEKIKILCPIHGIFYQTPDTHLRGGGCFKCAKNTKKTTNEFIQMSNDKHNNIYDYSKSIYCGNKKKVCIICKKHGEFLHIIHTFFLFPQ